MCTFEVMNVPKTILIAPLNWGLGHATRCIPIIKALLEQGFVPLIASDGIALQLLQKEFPELETLALPGYQIKYAKKGKYFKWKLLKDSPKLVKAVGNERKIVKKLVKEGKIQGIISDNRLGVYHKKVPSVFITHQLNVLTGKTTWLSSKAHQRIIKKFDECWVPDVALSPNLTGKLGHLKKSKKNVKYIGPLSRLKKQKLEKKYDLMVILSGPEPQRTLLENKLFEEVKHFKGKVLFVRGKVENKQQQFENLNMDVHNFMTSEQLQTAFNQSHIVLCRSGYTTIMDLAKLEKKAFLIPTPGQYEQEYLAKWLKNLGIAPSCSQKKFNINRLPETDLHKGFSQFSGGQDLGSLFGLFQGEREF